MAVGRKAKDDGARTPGPVSGRFGRLSPAGKGKRFVRDPDAARAEAIRAQVAVFEASGEEVPEHLAALAAGLPENELVVVLEVDAITGELPATEPEPEPEEEPEPDPEPEPEPEPEEESKPPPPRGQRRGAGRSAT